MSRLQHHVQSTLKQMTQRRNELDEYIVAINLNACDEKEKTENERSLVFLLLALVQFTVSKHTIHFTSLHYINIICSLMQKAAQGNFPCSYAQLVFVRTAQRN